MDSNKGLLVVFDGPSGTGKDSLIDTLSSELQYRRIPVSQLSEEDLDDRRHEILEAKERGKTMDGSGDRQMAEVLIEHRAAIYRQLFQPILEAGHIVFANRGEPATLAYQTARGELTMHEIWDMHRAAGIPTPDLVVLTTCSVATAVKRELQDIQGSGFSSVRNEREKGSGLSGRVTQESGAGEAEKLKRREAIHRQFDRVGKFLLEGRGVPVLSLNTEHMSVSQEVAQVLKALICL